MLLFLLIHSFSQPTIVPIDDLSFTRSLLFSSLWTFFLFRVVLCGDLSGPLLVYIPVVVRVAGPLLSFVILGNPLPYFASL